MFWKFIMVSVLMSGIAMASPSESEVKKLQNHISFFVMSMDGVNGIGVSTCKIKKGTEPCLTIFTENDKTTESLRTLFPSSKRVNGIIVTVNKIGITRLQ